MKHIYVPTKWINNWRDLTAGKERHWRAGCSAMELAQCWESASCWPKVYRELFRTSPVPALRDIELLLAIPEHRVGLPGKGHASQNDLFVLAKIPESDLVSVAVEAKVNESAGPTVGQWLVDASDNKLIRYRGLCDILGLTPSAELHSIRYQFFHRTVSAIKEALRFNADYAMMLVHSFSPQHTGFEDYLAFLDLFGVDCDSDQLVYLSMCKGIPVYTGWIADTQHTL